MAYTLLSKCPMKPTDVLVLYTLIFSILLPTIAVKKATAYHKKVCLTRGCHEAAGVILANINETANPCKDFYKFACGGYVNKTIIPENKSTYTRLTYIQDKVLREVKEALEEKVDPDEPRIYGLVKNFYKACNDLPEIERHELKSLRDIIDKLGGWPVLLGDAWEGDKFDWTEMDFKLRQIGYNPKSIFNLYVFNDIYNTTRNLLYIDPALPFISSASFKKGWTNGVVQAYYRHIQEVAKLLNVNVTRERAELRDVIDFERQLVLATNNSKGFQKQTITSIKDLQAVLPSVPWSKYLNSLTEPIIHLNDTDTIKVRNPYYVMNLNSVLENTPKRVIANYMIWRAIAESVPNLNEQMRKVQYDFKRLSTNNGARFPRWKECLELLTDKKGLTVGVSSLYVRKYFNNASRAAIKPILQEIVENFKYLLENSTWMDDTTKEAALRKTEFMKQVIAYPNELLNDDVIENYTKSLDFYPDNHLQNILNLNRFHFDYSIFGLLEATDRRLWVILSDSTVINAYYYVINNAFVLLAGMLQPPIFNYDWPTFSKFGSIGFIIGHEMMHAYDSKNSHFDETGSYDPSLLNEVNEEYTEKVNCFMNQYKKYLDKDLGLRVDGKLTLNENLADNVGIKVSFYAYKSWLKTNKKELLLPGLKYTPEQLFWITSVNFLCGKSTIESRFQMFMTEEHTPDNFRVMGTLSNSASFAKAFKCPVGSPMNPKKKCIFW